MSKFRQNKTDEGRTHNQLHLETAGVSILKNLSNHFRAE
jgi:hypothetical protein